MYRPWHATDHPRMSRAHIAQGPAQPGSKMRALTRAPQLLPAHAKTASRPSRRQVALRPVLTMSRFGRRRLPPPAPPPHRAHARRRGDPRDPSDTQALPAGTQARPGPQQLPPQLANGAPHHRLPRLCPIDRKQSGTSHNAPRGRPPASAAHRVLQQRRRQSGRPRYRRSRKLPPSANRTRCQAAICIRKGRGVRLSGDPRPALRMDSCENNGCTS